MTEQSGRHEFGDGCRAIDMGTVSGLARFGLICLATRYPIRCGFYDAGLSRLLIPFEAISAQKKIREYIKSTPEQTALSEFQSPGVFDSNKFPPNTIVKLTPSYRARVSTFTNDETKIPLYDHKLKTVTEVPRGWVETEVPTGAQLSKISRDSIGIIRKLPGATDHTIIYFENNQSKIMSGFMAPSVETKAIALGKETHLGLVGQYFNRVGFRLEFIGSMEKAEILAMGTPVKEKSKIPAERNPALAKAFSYFPS